MEAALLVTALSSVYYQTTRLAIHIHGTTTRTNLPPPPSHKPGKLNKVAISLARVLLVLGGGGGGEPRNKARKP